MDFLRGLTEEAQLERKGPAVLAAGVFDKFAGPLAPGVSDPGHHPINQ